MPWPTVPVVTTGMDADTDTIPRADILDHTQKFNQLIAMRGAAIGVCDLDTSTLVPIVRLPARVATLAGITAQQATDLASVSTFIGTLLNDADAATARATLGAGTGNGNGTVTGVTASAPVASSGGTAPNISMPAASAGADGYMSAGYASKLDGIAAGANVGVGFDLGVSGVGMMALCFSIEVSVASGATVAGSSLNLVRTDNNSIDAGPSLPGSWRNISGYSTNHLTGLSAVFQRYA